MRYLLVICARSKSSRLPLKHFQKITSEMTAIEILYNRITKQCSDPGIQICLATTTNFEDSIFQEKCGKDISVFAGDPTNIPMRQLEAAKKYKADVIISIDGDDVLTSPESINEVIKAFNCSDSPHQSVFYTSGLPLGMNVSLYSVNLLERVLKKKKYVKLETGWGRIFQDITKVEVELSQEWRKHLEELRFTLDYPEDLVFFQSIGKHFGQNLLTASSAEIIGHVLRDHLHRLNQSVIEQYWQNFDKEKREEVSGER